MIIKTLVENTSASDDFQAEYGFSLYIETDHHKILYDMGSSGLFAVNALKMGVDIASIDLAVLSHGHFDHGGGLQAFLNLNEKALVYVHQKAFDKHGFWKSKDEIMDVGINPALQNNERLIFAGDHMVINDELELFAGIKGKKLAIPGNDSLLMAGDADWVKDDFHHEQNLLIKSEGKNVLVAGCAHAGIVNILDHYYSLGYPEPDVVIGGFHFLFRTEDLPQASELVRQIGEILQKTGTVFYTGHCTGVSHYQELKRMLGQRIHYLSTGSSYTV